MPKTLTIRLDDETYESFVRCAVAENRSLSDFIETAVKTYIHEATFLDDVEMAEILANERLVERLKKGSRDAREKKGRLIE